MQRLPKLVRRSRMIQTNFEPYCEDCADLEPVVERLYGDDGVIQQVIACEHIRHCRKVAEFYREKGKLESGKGE